MTQPDTHILPRISIRDLHKSFGSNKVLDGIDFDVLPGQVIVVIGPSGSGKSTFLRCCNGLELPERGDITLCGKPLIRDGKPLPEKQLNELRKEVGMVFQSFNLFPHLSVLENLCVAPVMLRNIDKASAQRNALSLLEKVGLSSKAHAMPGNLSGGQKQRVAISRALAMSPSVMLFDEPTSALDPELVGEVLAVIRALAGAGMTMMVVSHELAFVRDVADEVAFMHQGRIVEIGPPAELLQRPATPELAAFIARFRTRPGPAAIALPQEAPA